MVEEVLELGQEGGKWECWLSEGGLADDEFL